MIIKIRKGHRPKRVSLSFDGKSGDVACVVTPTALFAQGSYDGETFTAMVYSGEKKGVIGGFVIACDAVRRRDQQAVAEKLAETMHFNGVRV
jgi:hypothetical protein